MFSTRLPVITSVVYNYDVYRLSQDHVEVAFENRGSSLTFNMTIDGLKCTDIGQYTCEVVTVTATRPYSNSSVVDILGRMVISYRYCVLNKNTTNINSVLLVYLRIKILINIHMYINYQYDIRR